MSVKVENAKIESVTLSMADHECLTFGLVLKGYGWGCTVGGYCLGHGYLGADEFTAENGRGLEALMRIMDVIGVERWEDLAGKYCRVKSDGGASIIKIIGNLINDKWFDIGAFFAEKSKGE